MVDENDDYELTPMKDAREQVERIQAKMHEMEARLEELTPNLRSGIRTGDETRELVVEYKKLVIEFDHAWGEFDAARETHRATLQQDKIISYLNAKDIEQRLDLGPEPDSPAHWREQKLQELRQEALEGVNSRPQVGSPEEMRQRLRSPQAGLTLDQKAMLSQRLRAIEGTITAHEYRLGNWVNNTDAWDNYSDVTRQIAEEKLAEEQQIVDKLKEEASNLRERLGLGPDDDPGLAVKPDDPEPTLDPSDSVKLQADQMPEARLEAESRLKPEIPPVDIDEEQLLKYRETSAAYREAMLQESQKESLRSVAELKAMTPEAREHLQETVRISKELVGSMSSAPEVRLRRVSKMKLGSNKLKNQLKLR
jgi:hypothetical protein